MPSHAPSPLRGLGPAGEIDVFGIPIMGPGPCPIPAFKPNCFLDVFWRVLAKLGDEAVSTVVQNVLACELYQLFGFPAEGRYNITINYYNSKSGECSFPEEDFYVELY